MDQIVVNNITEYICAVEKSVSEGENQNEEIWFRGQNNEDFKLEPSLYRNDILDIPSDKSVARLKYKRTYDLQARLKIFRNAIDMIEPNNHLSQFELMFIAQHKGMKTPLLDWTVEPLIALYFALFGAKNTANAVVYCLRTHLLNKNSSLVIDPSQNDIKEPIDASNSILDKWFEPVTGNDGNPFNGTPFAVYTSAEIEYRIARQGGKFTVHGPVHALNYRWNDIQVPYSDKSDKSYKFADSIIIPSKSFKELRKSLSYLGITKETVYGKTDIVDKFINNLDQMVPDLRI